MLSVERDLIERAVQAIINTSQMQPALNELRALLDKSDECRCKRYGKGNPHWPCPVHVEPVAQQQGEPVSDDQLIAIARNAALNSVHRYNYMPVLPEEAYKWEPHYWVVEAMRAVAAEQPAPVEHTMRSVMDAAQQARGFPVLTSNQCHALAEALNGVKP